MDRCTVESDRHTNLNHLFMIFFLIRFHTGVTVYAPSYVLNQSEIVVMFQSGAGLEVLENKGFMTTRVYLPWQFIVNI